MLSVMDGLFATRPRTLKRYKNVALSYEKPKSVTVAQAEKTPVERIREKAAAAAPTEVIGVTFQLKEQLFDWTPMRGLKDINARAAIVEARKTQLTPSQGALLSWLTSIGAKDIEPHWLTNSIYALVPAKDISNALARPDVVGASGTAVPTTELLWTGKEMKDGLRFTNLNNAGISGHFGGHSSTRVTIGIVESGGPTNIPYRTHVGFNRRPVEGGSRFSKVMDCDTNPCVAVTASPTADTHATRMAWVAAGSIESGQDSNFPGTNTANQQERSGALRDPYLQLFVASGTPGLYRGIANALFSGADVINLSWGETADCAATSDYGDINAAIKSAVDFGIVVVKSAGNSGGGPGCTLSWPAQRTEVITVGGLETENGNPAFPAAYDSLPIWSGSSRGGVVIQTHSQAQSTRAGIDLISPARLTSYFVPPGAGYSTGTTAGTSRAAPSIAAMVGALRNAFVNIGWNPNDARAMMANMLLMGDGWNADTGATMSAGMNSRSGAGRAKAHWPSSADLTGPWAWGWQAIHVNQGDSITWTVGDASPESAAVTQWKWAVLWTAPNLNDVPDVDFFVEDTCAGGGTMASDTGYDVRVRFRFAQAQISGRCLRMRATGWSVPPGGVTIYSADYFHSGSTVAH